MHSVGYLSLTPPLPYALFFLLLNFLTALKSIMHHVEGWGLGQHTFIGVNPHPLNVANFPLFCYV